MRPLLRSIIGLALLPYLALAQPQSPDEFLPHRLGETFTPHHLLVDYFEHVARESERVRLIEYGRTNEQRPLLLAFVSTPENLAQLEAIRLNHLRRAGLADGAPDPALDRAIVWLSYSVHGNEAAGSEASMGVLYDLAGHDGRTDDWLENTIVIMDPSVNPDGYSRYTHWYRGVATTSRDIRPESREHREPWPGGRTNHYYFDLNRDWAWQTQVESRQRIVQYKMWMPHVHADLHEQYFRNPYYFAPAAQPYHAYITEWQADFQETIGRNHARYFDENGWLYFTGEVFDLLYPSYGDTYPIYNGSIGMTYEQGGHSRGGRAIRMPNTDTLTLYDRVSHHRTTSLSTVEAASEHAGDLVQQFEAYFDRATNNPTGPYKTYIIKGGNGKDRLRAFTELLDRNGITYGRAESRGNLNAYHYQSGERRNVQIEANDLVISAYQPRSVLTQVLMDPTTELVDSLTYDITAWSLPYAYGLEAYATTSQVTVRPGYDFGPYRNQLPATPNAYAYVAPWQSTADAHFLAQLLKMNVQVRYSATGFQHEGRTYERGTLVITRADNRKLATFDATIRELARETQTEIYALSTGFTQSGPDLGSASMILIDAPRVAMLAGEGTFSNECGQVWYCFEQRLDYPVQILYTEDLEGWSGEEVDVLILPEGYYGMSDETAAAVGKWVREGGKLIAIGYALQSLAGKEGFGIAYKEGGKDEMPTDQTYGGQERSSISESIPGAVFGVRMDNSHPLAFGLEDTYFSLKTGTQAFAPLEEGWNVGRVPTDPLISGFVGAAARLRVTDALAFGVEEKGRGSLVYLVDNPLYRGFWENGFLLFSNAVFLVGNE